MTDVWTIISSLAGAVAAVFAGAQIWLSRRDANNRAVFEHLREIDSRVQAAWQIGIVDTQSRLLAAYRKEAPGFTENARIYLALLNSLDILAFAVKQDIVNGKVASEYLRTLLNPGVISLEFLRELQGCCGDPRVYEHLVAYLTDRRWGDILALPTSTTRAANGEQEERDEQLKRREVES